MKEIESYYAKVSILGYLPKYFFKDGVLNISNMNLEGTLETNCDYVICSNNGFKNIIAEDAIYVDISNNSVTELEIPNDRILICKENHYLSIQRKDYKNLEILIK